MIEKKDWVAVWTTHGQPGGRIFIGGNLVADCPTKEALQAAARLLGIIVYSQASNG